MGACSGNEKKETVTLKENQEKNILSTSTDSDEYHAKWDYLVKTHVDANGMVDYKGMEADREILESYLARLSAYPPDKKTWSDNKRLAYWINAYNAFTVKLIIDNYPVKSIKDLGGDIYKVNTTWDKKFIKIGNETLDLNNIEHKKIRKEFDDPRIHMAVNCASMSCPKLRNEAYTAEKLDQQLNDQVKDFLQSDKNDLNPEAPKVSSIFKWYAGDFKKDYKSVKAFINAYASADIKPGVELEYKAYDWSLNEQKN